MADRNERDTNIWVLVPLAALMIPIIAVAEGSPLVLAGVGLAFLVVVLSVVARSLMDHRHHLRLKEIEAEQRLIQEDRRRFEDANRVLERDAGLSDLQASLGTYRDEAEPDAETGVAEA